MSQHDEPWIDWEAVYDSACNELRDSLVGVNGAECVLVIDSWELRYRRSHPQLASFFRNHADLAKLMLLKTSGTTVNIIKQGHSSNFQQGNNLANAGSNVASGKSNTINVELPNAPAVAVEQGRQARKLIWASNLTIGIAAGVLAAWWLLPDTWAFGRTRLVLTVALTVAAVVTGFLRSFQFKRANWEKLVYISLGSALTIRASIPTVVGYIAGSGEASKEKAIGAMAGYLSLEDNPTIAGIQLVVGLVILLLGFFTRAKRQ